MEWNTRSKIERQEDADMAARQAERARDPGKSLEDPLGDIGREIERSALQRTLLVAGGSMTMAVLLSMPGGMSFVLPPALFGIMTLSLILAMGPSTYSLQARAKRHLSGRDDQYWIRMHSDIERQQNTEIWYEIADDRQALRDSNPPAITFIHLVLVINTLIWVMALA